MKYNLNTIKKIERDCNLCRSSFNVWLATLNFDRDKEENIRHHLNNHCPSCRIFQKTRKDR